MGVSGCGKSTVGALLAEALGCPFYEGDDFHPPANVTKMQAGAPLTDADRWPWLERLAAVVQRHLAEGQTAVLSCSALKPEYRALLRCGRGDGVAFVLIEPAPAALEARLARRAAAGRHFMPPSLLASQLSTLRYDPAELYLHFADEAALQPPADIVSSVLRRLREGQSGQPGQESPGQQQQPNG
ncbi:hypothetical protein ABPG77_001200 [Micractinium sp. CCAP 211/92]